MGGDDVDQVASEWTSGGGGEEYDDRVSDAAYAADDGGGGGGTPAVAAVQATISEPTAVEGQLPDGTTGVHVAFDITNLTGHAVPDGHWIAQIAGRSTDNAESSARIQYPLDAVDPGQTLHHGPLQLDNGTWTIVVRVFDPAGALVAESPPGSVVVTQGAHHARLAAVETPAVNTLAVQITEVTHEAPVAYRVHYLLHNAGPHAIPAGLEVKGRLITASFDGGEQRYQLQAPVEPNSSFPRYLTLECNPGGDDMTATIEVDHPDGSVSGITGQLTVHRDANGEITGYSA